MRVVHCSIVCAWFAESCSLLSHLTLSRSHSVASIFRACHVSFMLLINFNEHYLVSLSLIRVAHAPFACQR